MDWDAVVFTSSLDFDRVLLRFDILGDIAHVIMLSEAGILGRDDAKKILKGLKTLLADCDNLEFAHELEDIHMALEAELIRRIGDVGGKLHTARSRNDQVACDLRMWVREEVNTISYLLIRLIKTLLKLSNSHRETIMPGYTHLQHAQPTTLAHHLLSYCDAYFRNLQRLRECYKRINLNPLGAGALSTTSYPIDRRVTTRLLGFDGIIENSMDAVSSRDFLLETMASLSLLAVDISRFAEDLILWSTYEFGFVEISNEFASTSSIMPQKKNPDTLEIIRGKTGRVIGNLTACLAISKSLPNSYNRDLQEISPLASNSIEIIKASLTLMEKILASLKVNQEKMAASCNETFITATELADFFVKKKGLPFRTAHEIVGKIVSEAMKAGLKPSDVDLNFIEKVYGKKLGITETEVKRILSPIEAVKSRKTLGSPSPEETSRMIKMRERWIDREEENLKRRINRLRSCEKTLFKEVERLVG